MSGPDIGDKAPDFTAKLQNEDDWTLSENLKKQELFFISILRIVRPGVPHKLVIFAMLCPSLVLKIGQL